MLQVLREQRAKEVTPAALGLLASINDVLCRVRNAAHKFESSSVINKFFKVNSTTARPNPLSGDPANSLGIASLPGKQHVRMHPPCGRYIVREMHADCAAGLSWHALHERKTAFLCHVANFVRLTMSFNCLTPLLCGTSTILEWQGQVSGFVCSLRSVEIDVMLPPCPQETPSGAMLPAFCPI